ncbi:MAG: metallopeptidase TldD-related protein [Planctomycetota bacterium]|jgi:predicted Zn-dependent protease
MRATIVAILISACPLQAAVMADESLEQAMKQDVVLRALVDELERGKVGLELEDLERPYFIEYGLQDVAAASVSAALGAVTRHNEMRSRSLRTDLRVGSYELDNTNFGGASSDFSFGRGFGGMGGAAIPIEGDYYAIRQAIWWATDRGYKGAVEDFVKKIAFMETKLIEDKPEDFSREAPAVYVEDRIDPAVDLQPLEEMAVTLSAIFREYPDVQQSGVNISGGAGNKYLVNVEGTRLRISGQRFALSVSATVQADDGMKLSDSFSLHGRKLDELGSREQLEQRCRQMAEQLIKVKDAPTLESYTGPVLFEAKPAAALFSGRFARRFAGGQREVGSRTSPDDFENKLKKRILPRFMSVVDDPTRETIAGRPAMGHYLYDDQGVKARPVTLVEDGRLQALLMSRNPSKESKESTGHGRGAYSPRAAAGCLIVTAEDGADSETLKEELLEACQDEDLEYGIRIAALGSGGGGGRYGRYARARGGGGAGTPLAIYKVYPDGREELVRGAQIAGFDLKTFKRMLAAGSEPYVMNRGAGSQGRTVVAPAMLFEELDLAKIDQDFDKPPILPTPLARDSQQ